MPARRWEAAAIVGRTFGGFVVREPLSSGGFGMVFRAEQPALQRQAVVKVLHTHLLASESVVHRFLREAQLASRLDHPYAAHIYAFGAEPDGVLWIAMELVRGTPLDRLLTMQGPIPLERFVPLLERICEVVQSAHDQGIVHRDLKPGNVMVLARAGRLLPKLLDLGIAKVSSEPGQTDPDGSITSPEGFRTGTGPVRSTGGARSAAGDQTARTEPGIGSPAFDETAPGDTGASAPTPPGPAHHAVLAVAAATPASLAGPALAATTSSAGATPPLDSPSRGAALASVSSGRLTHVGATMGSPLYMAPEQWDDAGTADQRTDLYALAVLSYESLTGRTPFTGDSHMQIAAAHAMLAPPPLGGELPAELDAVMARALAKKPADRYGSVLEFAAAFRAASGIAGEAVALPQLDEEVRRAALARAPQPLAEALARLDAARNAHQARDGLWQVARTAARLIGVLTLASHSHVHADLRTTDPGLGEALRRLRGRALSDEGWLELSRGLVGPFATMRDAHPLPELVDVILGGGLGPLEELLELKREAEASGGVSEDSVRALLERAVPLCTRVLSQLAFLSQFPLVVPGEDGAEEWMGLSRAARTLRPTPRPLPADRPVLLDAAGVPVVALWPFLQVHEPAPGEPTALFFFEGRGRRGARLTALPRSFEVEDEALWESLGGMLSDSGDTPGSVQTEEVCPFPGLASFGRADAAHFIGRERETDAFLNRLRITPLLAVVGPSGAGKSSFVHAGVLAGLSDDWETISLRPGPAPLVSLAARLGTHGIDVAGLREELEEHPGAMGQILRAHAAARGVTLVLVVDQLEELFTLCDDLSERQLYAEALGRAARSVEDPVRVIVTLRDDFLLRAEALPALRSRLGPALQLITTPAPPDLRRILTVPIQRAGYEFDDPALPDEMVEEVSGTPAALALLSFTASKLWELRDRRFRQIAHKAYRSLGGVGGALARHAEATLQALHPEEQRLVREVFRHAVTAEGTRAVLTRAELDEVLGGGVHAQAAVEKLVAARLLVVSESEGGGERVEITHEALLDAWPRLVTWRREDAEGARLRDQLRAAARQWDERDRPSGLLWRGDALAEYRLWRARYPGALTSAEEAFAAASLAEAARGRRLRRLSLVLIIIGLASVAVVLLIQNKRVAAQRSAARQSAGRLHDLLLSQFENQGRRLVLADDPLQGLAYLYQAARLGADSPAHDFLVAEAVRATDGEVMALEHGNMVGRACYSPDGTLIATTGYDDQTVLWDARTGAVRAHLRHKGAVVRQGWSADSRRIATGGEDNTVVVWDSHTGKAIRRIALDATPQVVAFSPDGSKLLVDTTRDQVELYDPVSGARLAELQAGVAAPLHLAIGRVAGFSPDGTLVVAGDNNGVVRMWDAATAHPVARLIGHHDALNWLSFSADGFAAGGRQPRSERVGVGHPLAPPAVDPAPGRPGQHSLLQPRRHAAGHRGRQPQGGGVGRGQRQATRDPGRLRRAGVPRGVVAGRPRDCDRLGRRHGGAVGRGQRAPAGPARGPSRRGS